MGTWQPRDGPASYSAECVEGEFSEVRLKSILRSSAWPRSYGSVIYIGYMVEGKDGYEVERVVAVACRRCSDR
jgi:hypothetical protein